VLRWPALLGPARAAARLVWPLLARARRRNPAAPWLAARELPPLPAMSFREQWKQRGRRAASEARSEAPQAKRAARRSRAKSEGENGVIR
jgi:hypothetical protein